MISIKKISLSILFAILLANKPINTMDHKKDGPTNVYRAAVMLTTITCAALAGAFLPNPATIAVKKIYTTFINKSIPKSFEQFDNSPKEIQEFVTKYSKKYLKDSDKIKVKDGSPLIQEPGAFAITNNNKRYIVMGKVPNKITTETIALHELGHHINGDCKNTSINPIDIIIDKAIDTKISPYINLILLNYNKAISRYKYLIKQENDADAFAAEQAPTNEHLKSIIKLFKERAKNPKYEKLNRQPKSKFEYLSLTHPPISDRIKTFQDELNRREMRKYKSFWESFNFFAE